MQTIGQRVRRLREERGLSRPELAAAVGMKKTTLQTLEEKPQRSTRHLVAIASYFGVNPEWLATGKGPREARVNVALDEYGWASHFGKFDQKALGMSLRWMRWQDERGLVSQDEQQVGRLIAMYRRFLADGGETAAHVAEIARAIKQGESNEGTRGDSN